MEYQRNSLKTICVFVLERKGNFLCLHLYILLILPIFIGFCKRTVIKFAIIFVDREPSPLPYPSFFSPRPFLILNLNHLSISRQNKVIMIEGYIYL